MLVTSKDGRAAVVHQGVHNHPRPPPEKPSPAGKEHLAETVRNNPTAGPALLRRGLPGQVPMREIDPAFNNLDILAHNRRKILGKQASVQGVGIRNSTAALFQLAADLPNFFKDICLDSHSQVITMQTDSMKEVLNNSLSGLQSDTVEGMCHDIDFKGQVCLHFTSQFFSENQQKECAAGKKVVWMAYEVQGKNDEDIFGRISHNWSKTFIASREEGFVGFPDKSSHTEQKHTNTPASGKRFLEDLSQSIKEQAKKKFKPKAQTLEQLKLHIDMDDNPDTHRNVQRNSRIPRGWSVPKNSPTRGPNPVCRGCNRQIERGELRARNNHLARPIDQHKTVHQFHLKVECLQNLPEKQLQGFLQKRWSQKAVLEVQNKLKTNSSPKKRKYK